MRILITNNTLTARGGSEMYVRDVCLALVARGCTPIAYSTHLGDVADELRRRSVAVVDDLSTLKSPPDVIHGQHHLDAWTAMLHFPSTPAIYFCHGWLPWEEAPPPEVSQLRRYLAVDHVCRDRLMLMHGIAEERIEVLANFVDLNRFARRAPLPPTPQRALLFSNYACEATHLPAVRAACAAVGLPLDVVGLSNGNATPRPESVLGGYDLVFAKGRAALEALATGAAVVVCDASGVGPMVASADFDRLRRLNFGFRLMSSPLSQEAIVREIRRYDANDAAAVTARVRAEAGIDAVVDRLVAIYSEVVAEHAAAPRRGARQWSRDSRTAAKYFRGLVKLTKSGGEAAQVDAAWSQQFAALQAHATASEAAWMERFAGLQADSAASERAWSERCAVLQAEAARKDNEHSAALAAANHRCEELQREVRELRTSRPVRWVEGLRRAPILGAAFRTVRSAFAR